MNKAIALKQYSFQNQPETKKNSKVSSNSSSESPFAEKMRAAQRKNNSSRQKQKPEEMNKQKNSKRQTVGNSDSSKSKRPKKDELPAELDAKKMLEQTAEEVIAQLSQLDLGSVDQQKLASLLEEVGLLEVAGDNLFLEDTESNLELSKLNTSNLESLISDLETLITDSEIDPAADEELDSLLSLLKELESGKDPADNQLFRKKFADHFELQGQIEEKTDKTVSSENSEQLQTSENIAVSENTAGKEKTNVDFTSSDQNELSQKVDFEQKKPTEKTLRQESTEKNTAANKSKVEQESKLFSTVEQKEVSEFNSKLVLETTAGDKAAEKKIIDFNFSGAEPSLSTEMNAGDRTNNFVLNNSDLKGELPVKDQFVKQFKGEFSAAKNEMNIELKPESLGKIEVKLNLNDGKIDARMLVENKLVQTQLESSMKEIKSDLIKQGINIEQFKVETAKAGPRQIEQQSDFNFNDQNSAFSDGETGQNQEYEQRQFFQGQYYVQRGLNNSGLDNLDGENLIMRQQEIINRAAFSQGKLNLIV